jgi:hypothetical protein
MVARRPDALRITSVGPGWGTTFSSYDHVLSDQPFFAIASCLRQQRRSPAAPGTAVVHRRGLEASL